MARMFVRASRIGRVGGTLRYRVGRLSSCAPSRYAEAERSDSRRGGIRTLTARRAPRIDGCNAGIVLSAVSRPAGPSSCARSAASRRTCDGPGTGRSLPPAITPAVSSPGHRLVRENNRQHPLAAIGIASFGPVDLVNGSPSYGHITSTPEAGLGQHRSRRADSAGAWRSPVGFDTDTNGAGLGEYFWGEAAGLDDFVYITIGTGIGAAEWPADGCCTASCIQRPGTYAFHGLTGDTFAGGLQIPRRLLGGPLFGHGHSPANGNRRRAAPARSPGLGLRDAVHRASPSPTSFARCRLDG